MTIFRSEVSHGSVHLRAASSHLLPNSSFFFSDRDSTSLNAERGTCFIRCIQFGTMPEPLFEIHWPHSRRTGRLDLDEMERRNHHLN